MYEHKADLALQKELLRSNVVPRQVADCLEVLPIQALPCGVLVPAIGHGELTVKDELSILL